jgi:hypothetical protein
MYMNMTTQKLKHLQYEPARTLFTCVIINIHKQSTRIHYLFGQALVVQINYFTEKQTHFELADLVVFFPTKKTYNCLKVK